MIGFQRGINLIFSLYKEGVNMVFSSLRYESDLFKKTKHILCLQLLIYKWRLI